MNPVRWLVISLIKVYQKVVSPFLGPRCKYYPSCSEYAAQSIERYGILRGLVLAIWRVLRCNPFSSGGVDRVDDQRLFKATPKTASVQ